jgi:hypothetical protein
VRTTGDQFSCERPDRPSGGYAASCQALLPGTTDPSGSTYRRPGGPTCCAPTKRLQMRGAGPGKPGRRTAAASRRTPHGAGWMGSAVPRMFAGRSGATPLQTRGRYATSRQGIVPGTTDPPGSMISRAQQCGCERADRANGGYAAMCQAFLPGTTDPPGSTYRRPGGPICCAPTKRCGAARMMCQGIKRTNNFGFRSQ